LRGSEGITSYDLERNYFEEIFTNRSPPSHLLAAAPVDTLAPAHRRSIHVRRDSHSCHPSGQHPTVQRPTQASHTRSAGRWPAAPRLPQAHSRDAGVHPTPALALPSRHAASVPHSPESVRAAGSTCVLAAAALAGAIGGQGQRPGDSICGATRPGYRHGGWG
jgi:hypothetical protein